MLFLPLQFVIHVSLLVHHSSPHFHPYSYMQYLSIIKLDCFSNSGRFGITICLLSHVSEDMLLSSWNFFIFDIFMFEKMRIINHLALYPLDW